MDGILATAAEGGISNYNKPKQIQTLHSTKTRSNAHCVDIIYINKANCMDKYYKYIHHRYVIMCVQLEY